MHIVLTDDELAMSRLEIVPWERQLDADVSVLPVRLPAYMASRLTLFGLHDTVESDAYPVMTEPWMRTFLRCALGSFTSQPGFEASARSIRQDPTGGDDDGAGVSPPTSPPDQPATAAQQSDSALPQTPATAGGVGGSVGTGTYPTQNQTAIQAAQTMASQFRLGVSPISHQRGLPTASPMSPTMQTSTAAAVGADVSAFMGRQTELLGQMASMLSLSRTASAGNTDDQHITMLNRSKIKRHTINLSQQAKAGTIAQATVTEFENMDKDEEGNVLGEIYAREAIIATLSHALVNDDKTLKMAPSASEDQKILDAISAKAKHTPMADYARRHFLPGFLNTCGYKTQQAAYAKLLAQADKELQAAWKSELKNRTSTADESNESDVIKFAIEHDPQWADVFGDDIPMFAHTNYRLAELMLFLCKHDKTLYDSRRKTLEWIAVKRIKIPATMFMKIEENGTKVELFRDWERRLTTETSRQKLLDHLAKDDPRTWVIKMLYSCPAPIQDMFWDRHDQTIFEKASTWDEDWMKQQILSLIKLAKPHRNFTASPALEWGSPASKNRGSATQPNTRAAANGRAAGGGQGASQSKGTTGGGRIPKFRGRRNELKVAEVLEPDDKFADDCTDPELGVLSNPQAYASSKGHRRDQGKGKGKSKGKGNGKGRGKGSNAGSHTTTVVGTDGRKDTPQSIENGNGKWMNASCIPGRTQSTSALHCDNADCMAEAREYIYRNPGRAEAGASTFNHTNVACPFAIAKATKLVDHPDVEDLRHAANIIRNKHRVELNECAFGKGSKFNRINGQQRPTEVHKELRKLQWDANLFDKTKSRHGGGGRP
jgi:hypothetical protein